MLNFFGKKFSFVKIPEIFATESDDMLYPSNFPDIFSFELRSWRIYSGVERNIPDICTIDLVTEIFLTYFPICLQNQSYIFYIVQPESFLKYFRLCFLNRSWHIFSKVAWVIPEIAWKLLTDFLLYCLNWTIPSFLIHFLFRILKHFPDKLYFILLLFWQSNSLYDSFFVCLPIPYFYFLKKIFLTCVLVWRLNTSWHFFAFLKAEPFLWAVCWVSLGRGEKTTRDPGCQVGAHRSTQCRGSTYKMSIKRDNGAESLYPARSQRPFLFTWL